MGKRGLIYGLIFLCAVTANCFLLFSADVDGADWQYWVSYMLFATVYVCGLLQGLKGD